MKPTIKANNVIKFIIIPCETYVLFKKGVMHVEILMNILKGNFLLNRCKKFGYYEHEYKNK